MNKNIRNKFPFFKNNQNLIYLDTAASSLKLQSVIDEITNYYETNGANVFRGVYKLSHYATEKFENTRKLVSKLINSEEDEVIFTKGTTDSLNSLAFSLSNFINEDDEIITSELEHHSSLLPWQVISLNKNAKLKYIPLNHEGKITLNNFLKVLTKKTKVVALTHISNSIGYETPIKDIVKKIREFNKDIIVILDAAQSIAHQKIDVKDLDVDFLAFSAHKMYGPSGVGVLFGKKKLLKKIPPFEYGGEMAEIVKHHSFTYKDIPYKFEAGTPNIAGVIGFSKAVEFLLNNDLNEIKKHEEELKKYTVKELEKIDEIIIYNKSSSSSITTFNVLGVHPHDIASLLDQENISLRAGHHCAQLVNNKLKVISTLRVSYGVYNTKEEIDKFIIALKKAIKFFKQFGV